MLGWAITSIAAGLFGFGSIIEMALETARLTVFVAIVLFATAAVGSHLCDRSWIL